MNRSDSRKHQRLEIRLAAELGFADGARYRVMTRNLSFGGAFVLGVSLAARHGDTCSFRLYPRLDRPEDAIRLQARVVHTQSDGSAVQFIASSTRNYERFSELMLTHSPEPERLRDELAQLPGYLCSNG